MYQVNDDLSIYVTRGDAALLNLTAKTEEGAYTFRQGELVRFRVFERKNCSAVVLIKDVPVTADGETVQIYLSGKDTHIGKVISRPTDYWYEVEIDPLGSPQTIVGYDEDGPKLFRLFPEGDDGSEKRPSEEPSALVGKELCGYILSPEVIYGKSAYEIAVAHGFDGTEEEWIKSVTAEADRAEKAAENATQAATDEVTRLVGEIGIVQETGDSETAVMSQKAVSSYIRNSANALKGTANGSSVAMDDVSPFEHIVHVKLTGGSGTSIAVTSCGKNIFNSRKIKYNGAANVDRQNSNEIVLSQEMSANYRSANFALPNSLVGKKVTISADVKTSGTNSALLRIMWVDSNNGATGGHVISDNLSTATAQKLTATGVVPAQPDASHDTLCLMLYSNGNGTTTGGVKYTVTYANIQIEVNDIATPSEPYIEGDYIITKQGDIELSSIAPNMTIFTDNANVTLDVTYNKDANKVIEKLTEAIISLGGNI